jgi:hypothetical protein
MAIVDNDKTTQLVDRGHQLAKIAFGQSIEKAKGRYHPPVLDAAVGTVVCRQEARIGDAFALRDPSE